jgi:hypothetical protein
MASPGDKPKKRELVRLVLDFIFGFKNKRGEVLDGWLYSADEFSLDPQEFYTRVEKHLEDQKIPGMEISRVEFAEGGLLSNQRQYMRLMRERFTIDTCAATFGKHFFFSCRCVHVPALIRLWHIVAIIGFFGIVGTLLVKPLGFIFAIIAMVALLFAIVGVLRNAEAFTDLDNLLLKIPVVATVYEDWFRVETYYRMDTRTLYKNILPDLIKAAAEEFTADKGVKLVRRDELPPVFVELHPPTR